MTNVDLEKIRALLRQCDRNERQELFQMLRQEFTIHELERKLNTSAEVILEAIDRSTDPTLRGLRGVIAEAAFKDYIVVPYCKCGWKDVPIKGNHAFVFCWQIQRGSRSKFR